MNLIYEKSEQKKLPLSFQYSKYLVQSDLERDLRTMFSTNIKWKNQVITATKK